uniref:Uncharacterized protein n=1 Tax=Cyanidioschyzon merolae (strain NIES-3377 / 10D) TaxID=280699 RepID=Q85G39_CYAM1|nr:ORF40 [Cyanidioschyzon merolae strain 10D]BAC76152.1 unnamed protein product [Cyanidioschyzon merolae strain 10D]
MIREVLLRGFISLHLVGTTTPASPPPPIVSKKSERVKRLF